MTWTQETSNGNETDKIRYRALPYCRGAGLDIGCGPWKIFPTTIGIDGNAYRGAAQGPSLVMPCDKLPMFSSAFWDYVYSSHLLEHIVDTEATLREWVRLLAVEGYLVLYLPHKKFYPNMGQPGSNPDHKHDFMPQDIVDLMRKIGGVTLLENEDRAAGNEYSFFQVYQKRADDKFVEAVQVRPAKSAAIVRPGIYGDALFASSVAAGLKEEGYHVTVYCEEHGEEILRLDPNVDRIICMDRRLVPTSNWLTLWDAERPRYDRWVNLTESLEVSLLYSTAQVAFHWPKDKRHERANKNYVAEAHAVAGVPYKLRQKFYPSTDEATWAANKRGAMLGRVVVLVPAGSTWPKFWPAVDALAKRLAEVKTHVVILGDTRARKFDSSPYIHEIGLKWSIRQAMAFCQVADVVVGQETGLLNAVAIEPLRKVVLLSHSTRENLTRDWINTITLYGDVPCYPCHQVHYDAKTCTKGVQGNAACQEAITVDEVLGAIRASNLIAATLEAA